MRSLAIVTAGALGVWLGMQTIRAFLAVMAWNVTEDHTTELALIGGAIWLVGLAGWLGQRLVGGGDQGVIRLAALFGLLVVARLAVGGEVPTAIFAIGAVIAWLWWLPAFVDLLTRRNAATLLVPAILLGVAAEVAGQLILKGIDLHALIGAGPGMVAAVLVGTLVVMVAAVVRNEPAAADDEGSVNPWAPAALLPFVFLQLTLMANLGRIEMLAGFELPAAGVLAILGLGAASVAIRWAPGRLNLIAIAAATVALVYLAGAGGSLTWLLVGAQAGVTLLLAAALTAPVPPEASRRSVYAEFALGGVAFFALLFVTYISSADTFARFTWPIGAAIVALAALATVRQQGGVRFLTLRWANLVVSVGAIGVLFASAPGPVILSTAPPLPITLLDYNIHQGMGRDGVPSLPRQADVMIASGAEVLMLQEVNRVWDLSGAIDSYSWLWAQGLGDTAVWAPMHGVHFGLAIFTRRYRITDWGTQMFPLGASGTPRSFVWATVDTPAGAILLVTTHLTPYNRGDEATERDAQAQILLDFWHGRGSPRMVLTGDLNAELDSATIRRLAESGLVDALAEGGIGTDITFRSTGNLFAAPSAEKLDYVYITPDLTTVSARIIDTDASDHYPILVQLQPR